jgi:hypothetical protein
MMNEFTAVFALISIGLGMLASMLINWWVERSYKRRAEWEAANEWRLDTVTTTTTHDEDVPDEALEQYVVIHMVDTGDAIRLFEFQDAVAYKVNSGYVPCGGIVFSGEYMYQAVYLPVA